MELRRVEWCGACGAILYWRHNYKVRDVTIETQSMVSFSLSCPVIRPFYRFTQTVGSSRYLHTTFLPSVLSSFTRGLVLNGIF